MKIKKGISLVGINDNNVLESICYRYPDAWFELSYLSTEESLKQQLPLIKGKISSVHMLCPTRDYFPNLASRSSFEWSRCQILRDAEYAASVGADVLVLHPGYLTDGLLFTQYEKRLAVLKSSDLEQYMLIPDEGVCRTDYIKSTRYLNAFCIMTEQLIDISEQVKKIGVTLAAENLNPRAGYLVLHPDEIISLAENGININLDIGHLQVCSALFGFDLYEEAERILKTGMVRSMHLHSNESRNGVYKDSHRSFDKYMDYRKIVQMAEKAESNMILEVLEEPERNLSLLLPD